MAKRTKAEAMQTRQKILDSALEIFFEKNYSEVKITEIAEKIGLTKGAVYWHFKNKDEILQSLINETFIKIGDETAKKLQKIDSLEKVRDYSKGVLNGIKIDDKNIKLYQIMLWKRGWPQEMQDKVNTIVKEFIDKERSEFCKILVKAQESGVVKKNVNAKVLADMLVSMINGFARLELAGQFAGDLNPSVDMFFDALDAAFCTEKNKA